MKLTGQPNQRSEEIRRRRLEQSHAAQNSAKQREVRIVTPTPPPVMARTPMAGVSRPTSRGSKKSRRLYNVSLDARHGAEMSIPALPRLGLSWRMLSIVLVGLLGFALYNLWESAAYRVDAPQISGLKRLNSNQVNTTLGLVGKPVFTLSSQAIQTDLLTVFPELSAAEVQIELPNTVLITVTERIPVLTWVRDSESYLVDAQGITLPLRSANPAGTYPTIEATGDPPEVVLPDEQAPSLREQTIGQITGIVLPGFSPEDQVKPLLYPEMVQSILFVSEQAPAGSKLIYDPVHGLGWTDRRGWSVYLGSDQEMEIKLQIYRAIFEQLKAEEARPTMISVEYVHAPYYRMEQ